MGNQMTGEKNYQQYDGQGQQRGGNPSASYNYSYYRPQGSGPMGGGEPNIESTENKESDSMSWLSNLSAGGYIIGFLGLVVLIAWISIVGVFQKTGTYFRSLITQDELVLESYKHNEEEKKRKMKKLR
jgi:hypothetical protein